MSRRGKVCLGCCVGAVITVAIIVPIAIFVIMPKIAQGTLNNTLVTLKNSTMFPCSTMIHDGELVNSIEFTVPGLFKATLHSVKQTLLVNGKTLGSYDAPEMAASPGTNHVNFTTVMTIPNSTFLINDFLFPMFLVPNGTQDMIITAEDVHMTVFGITMSGLKMHNEVTCEKLETVPYQTIPKKYCPDKSTDLQMRSRRLDATQGYAIVCKPSTEKNTLLLL